MKIEVDGWKIHIGYCGKTSGVTAPDGTFYPAEVCHLQFEGAGFGEDGLLDLKVSFQRPE